MPTSIRYLPLLLALAASPVCAQTVRVYVTNSAGDSIHVIDPATNKVVQVINGVEATHGIDFSPDGTLIGRAGGQHVIVPGGPPMHLTATGTEQRRALVLILHESAKPASSLAHDWKPKGLCKNL